MYQIIDPKFIVFIYHIHTKQYTYHIIPATFPFCQLHTYIFIYSGLSIIYQHRSNNKTIWNAYFNDCDVVQSTHTPWKNKCEIWCINFLEPQLIKVFIVLRNSVDVRVINLLWIGAHFGIVRAYPWILHFELAVEYSSWIMVYTSKNALKKIVESLKWRTHRESVSSQSRIMVDRGKLQTISTNFDSNHTEKEKKKKPKRRMYAIAYTMCSMVYALWWGCISVEILVGQFSQLSVTLKQSK